LLLLTGLAALSSHPKCLVKAMWAASRFLMDRSPRRAPGI